MIPVFGVVAALVMVGRALNNKGNSSPNNEQAGIREISRGSRSFWNDSGAGGTLLIQILLFLPAWTLLIWGIDEREPMGFLVSSGFFIFLNPWFIARRIFIPLGLARLAYAISFLSRVQWRRDKPGGPALAACLALIHDEKPSPKSLAWLEGVISESEKALQGSDVVASGLLSAMRGQREAARQMLESVLSMHAKVCPRFVLKVAGEWLATDAAADGDWERVLMLTSNRRWPNTFTMSLLNALARRHLGHPLPTNAGLWLWWALAPRRLWTYSFVAKTAKLPAGTQKPQPQTKQPTASAPLQGVTFAAALETHAELLRFDSVDVIRAAQHWEAALNSDALRTHLMQRSLLLGGGNPSDTLDAVRALVSASLAPLAAQHKTEDQVLPDLIKSASSNQRDANLRELDDRMARMSQRQKERREINSIDEWREFIALKALYLKCCSSMDLGDRSLAQSTIRDRLVDYAVWLYNDRLQRPLANAIFRFLEVEALSVGDSENETLNKKNSACAL